METNALRNRVMRKIAVYLVEYLMEAEKCTRDEAVAKLLKTNVYTALMDPETELYTESRECVLDILKEELAGNPDRLLEL